MRHLVEHRLGRLAAHDEIGDRVGVPLVGVPGASDAAGQAHAAALLHHVRRLVRRQVEIELLRERHRVAGR